MSLQRFIERLIWLCMLPLILLGAVLLTLHLHTLNERRQMLVDSVARAAARSLDQMLEVRLTSLALLGRMIDDGLAHRRGQLDLDQAHRLAVEYHNLHGHHVLIASEARDMLVNTRVPRGQPLPKLPEPQGRSSISAALAMNIPAVGDPFVGPITGSPMVALVVPLNLSTRHRLLLLTNVETTQLRERLAAYSLPKGWVLNLHDSTAQPMFPNPETVPGRDGPGLRSTGSLTQAPWTVVLNAPPVSLFDDPALRTVLLMMSLLVTVALAYWGGRMASGRLVREMKALTQPEAQGDGTQAIQEIRFVRDQLHRLAREREAAQEAERRRIGLELHDELQQKLALMRHELHRWHGEEALQARRLVDDTIDATRRLVQDLRPSILQELGLPEALQALADDHQRAHGQTVDVQVRDGLPWESLPDETATVTYRIAQEALNNARKHSRADSIHICLTGHTGRTDDERGEVVLEVTDDGVGFEPTAQAPAAGNGLRGMAERAQALGGRLEVVSKAGDGAAVIAHLPWPPGVRGDAHAP